MTRARGHRIAKGRDMARVPQHIESKHPFRFALNAESVGITPEKFFRLCADNPELRLELTARKEIVIMPPSGGESSWKTGECFGQLRDWAKRDGTGMALESSAGYILPNGAIRAPDCSWLTKSKWDAISANQRKKFLPVCPDFVIEVRSPSDTLPDQQAKMTEYLGNGARLGFLVDPIKEKLYVYRPGQEPQCLKKPKSVSADPELPRFTLDLTDIW